MNLDDTATQLLSLIAQAKERIIAALPNFVTAVVVLFIGWSLAWLLRKTVRRVFRGLAVKMPPGTTRTAWAEAVDDQGAGNVAASGVYWLILLTTVMVAIDALGIPVFNKWLGAFASYLPRFAIAMVLVFGGFVAGRVARHAITKTATRLLPTQVRSLARLTQIAIVVATSLIAAEQLGLDVSVLTALFLIVLAATLGGAALAFGLGAREVMADILAMHYVNKSFRVGQVVRVGSDQGRIVRTTSTSVFLENAEGELSIPGRHFGDQRCVLLTQEESMELEKRLLDAFVTAHPAEVARALESMPVTGVAEVWVELSVEPLAELLQYLAPLVAASSLELTAVDKVARALCVTRRDVAATILRLMGSAERARVIESMTPEDRKAIAPLLRYSEGTAGALMDPGVLAVAESVSAGEALERLRVRPQHALYYVYVVSEDLKLVGVVNLRELMGARPDQPIGLIAAREVMALPVRASWKAIAAHPGWKQVHALPVVEADGRFLGVVRYESVRALEEQLIGTALGDHGATTGAALGELYGIGLRGIFEWAASTVFGSNDSQGGSR